jgi:predicted transcriptional regulator
MAVKERTDGLLGASVVAAPPGAESQSALINALEKPEFKWRTVEGLAAELKRTPGDILAELQRLIDQGVVIRSTVATKNGEELFTTRKHYNEMASPVERFAAVFRNRAS